MFIAKGIGLILGNRVQNENLVLKNDDYHNNVVKSEWKLQE